MPFPGIGDYDETGVNKILLTVHISFISRQFLVCYILGIPCSFSR